MITAAKMTRAQADAIREMGPGLHEYNRGVLAMLGMLDIALAHEGHARRISMLVADRDALRPPPVTFADLIADLSPEGLRLQMQIDEERMYQAFAWEPIQELIDEARLVAE